ncbi:hypothetical protein BBO99_00002231 [Phytophthora kernoviae]|uniref:HTH myb-type domain-containing protein n=2 Tax=Phytophthora kernoviae TaxID=325452 RepID=A0A3R7FX42_9STRA|nr:hypothetical protein G195_008144 [Phytophthora kernoviae 00238/432]KAG2529675.1 hypothetical protein JM16_001893 [Phytophthora kernoviae]KAG2531024.1 hypothetical protein JM18_001893 [Phytophthora kernoviae]RLN05830.1 hypothetical protein BBI17_007159 [Phytophthora kernoviae]RLN83299.1 hypothetical protein BBO99_00002231 [Phytophthora kernoviae]
MISPEVMQELLAVRQVLHYLPESQCSEKGWSPQEQQIFWAALTKYPQGPWTTIAGFIGTKTTRQAMTHAQKLRQKLKRWNSRLRSNPAPIPFMLGLHPNAQAAALESGISPGSMVFDDMYTSIPHDFVDSLIKSLCEEDLEVEDEVTEEQLKELGDGEDYSE